MIEIFYLAHNRKEFTEASLLAMVRNTNWAKVSRVVFYDDDSVDGASKVLASVRLPVPTSYRRVALGSPVAVMNEYLTEFRPQIFAKIDSDVMLPPGWLDESLEVLDENPTVDLLGIEAMHAVAPGPREAVPAEFIGGIGLMRGRAFAGRPLPTPDGRFGFTDWQDKNPGVVKAWISPALKVFLLDRLPMNPWRSWSEAYVAKGWQRRWTPYDAGKTVLWDWWTP